MIRKSFDSVVVIPHKKSVVIEKEFRLSRDVNGTVIYRSVGEKDVNQYINSFKDGCSLESLLMRCSLMTPRDKFISCQQCEDGQSVDLSNYPTDLTDALIKCRELANTNPELFKRISSGESINSIVKSLYSDIIKDKEVSTNGEIESSNE